MAIDHVLKLYAETIRSPYLHYGYWDEPEKVNVDSLSIDKDLEKLIKAWLGFQAESLQKQANEFSKFNEKLEDIKKAPASMQTFGRKRRGNRGGGKSRMQSVAIADLGELKEDLEHKKIDMEAQKKQQEEIQKKFDVVEEKPWRPLFFDSSSVLSQGETKPDPILAISSHRIMMNGTSLLVKIVSRCISISI